MKIFVMQKKMGGETSRWLYVLGSRMSFFPEVSKCLGDIMSGWQNVSATQCPGGKMSRLQNVRVSKCLSVKMSKCQNVEVSKVGRLQNVRCRNVGEPIPSQNRTIPEPPQHSCPWTPPVWAQNLSPVSSKRQNLDIKDEISYITFKIRIQFEF